MHILTKWGFRKQRENAVRTFTAVFALSSVFALLSRSAFIVEAMIRANGTADGLHSGGILSVITNHVWAQMDIVSLLMLLSLFSVTVRECMQDHCLLSSAGATRRQILRSLMARAMALDVTALLIGVSVGVLLSRLSLDRETFLLQMPWYFREARTLLTLLTAFLLAPAAMLLVSWRLLLPIRRRRRPRTPRRSMFRHSLTRRTFGVGGVLGRLGGRGMRSYQALFTLALAFNVAVTAMLYGMCGIYADATSVELDYNIEINYIYHPDREQSIDERLRSVLRECEADGSIDYSFDLRSTDLYFAYTLVPDAWISPQMHRSQARREWAQDRGLSTLYPVPGSGVQMIWTPTCVFLPDDVFARLAERNGVDPNRKGALLCNAGETRLQTAPILTQAHPDETVEMHILPNTFTYEKAGEWDLFYLPADDTQQAPDVNFDPADFLRASRAVSRTVRYPIVGLLPFSPLGNAYGIPMLFFPQSMYADFASADNDPLYASQAASSEYKQNNLSERVMIAATDHEKVCSRLREAAMQEDCQLIEIKPGTGVTRSEKTYWTDGQDEGAACYVWLQDYVSLDRGNAQIRARWLPVLQSAIVWMTGITLVADILNMVHLNRMLRRREDAMLTSIGMERRHRLGMHLYDAVFYSLQSIVLSLLIFFVAYHQVVGRDVIVRLANEGLQAQGMPYMYSYSTSYIRIFMIQETVRSLGRCWWIFAVAGITAFGVFLLSALWIDRRSRREDLIRVLKNDNYV